MIAPEPHRTRVKLVLLGERTRIFSVTHWAALKVWITPSEYEQWCPSYCIRTGTDSNSKICWLYMYDGVPCSIRSMCYRDRNSFLPITIIISTILLFSFPFLIPPSFARVLGPPHPHSSLCQSRAEGVTLINNT